jgi:tetratricopeptide (TPR) repeat protein
VHSTFLKKYVLANHFADVFSKGEYNCVSATALYALVLQELNIPFTIKETPTHVFLVAYPATDRIALESTDPQVGYMVFDTKFKTQYVAQLRKMKLISEQDYQSKGVEKLFDEMYFNNQDISLKELIALQYYNDGLYLMDEEKWESSLQQFEKGYALYPCDRGGFLIYNSILLAKDKKTYADTAYIDYLVKLANIVGIDNYQEQLKGEWALFTDDQLSNKGQAAYYDKMYHKLLGSLSDTSLVDEISYIYYFEKGRTAFSAGQFTEGLKWSENAFQLKPEATNSTGLLLGCIGQRLNTIYALDEKTSFLEGYLNKYPALENNNILYSQLLQFYLVRFGQAYELDQEKKGIQYRQIFEQAYQRKKGGTEAYILDNALLGRAYSVAAVYYFRRGQTAQARQLLNKGLEVDPHNHELLQRKQMIR